MISFESVEERRLLEMIPGGASEIRLESIASEVAPQ